MNEREEENEKRQLPRNISTKWNLNYVTSVYTYGVHTVTSSLLKVYAKKVCVCVCVCVYITKYICINYAYARTESYHVPLKQKSLPPPPTPFKKERKKDETQKYSTFCTST